MATLPELIYLSISINKLVEYANQHESGDFLIYLLNMAAAQIDLEYSLAMRLHDVQNALAQTKQLAIAAAA